MKEQTVNGELQDYVENKIIPRYEHFDKAHGISHVETVIAESLKLAAHYDVDINMVCAIAAYHDTGLIEGREWHHIVSGEILIADDRLRQWFSEEQLTVMREAIEDHRASNANPPRAIYGMIVSEADRDIDPIKTFRRAIQYAVDHNPGKTREEYFDIFSAHIHEKYAADGYIRLWIPYSSNAEKLAEMREIIDDPKRLRAVFDDAFL
ncbi:MAG: phosphohydrolase [Bacteroidales bacterium]|nr:phosphohydrolase [Bacteroidales bacterium]